MMPPPRRFSAAPTLTCPHRNKSSSHSGSSLHHTCSIDSSESMITVIPANRSADFVPRRSPRGSLSTSAGGSGTSGGVHGMAAGSCTDHHYASGGLPPRSPLSPRSPSRLSPGMLTPTQLSSAADPLPPVSSCVSELLHSSSSSQHPQQQLPHSPSGATSSTANTSTGQVTCIAQHQGQQPPAILATLSVGGTSEGSPVSLQQQQQQPHGAPLAQPHISIPLIRSQYSSQEEKSSCYNITTLPDNEVQGTPTTIQDCESSLAVENGTSFDSSRNDLNEFFPELDSEIERKQKSQAAYSKRMRDFLDDTSATHQEGKEFFEFSANDEFSSDRKGHCQQQERLRHHHHHHHHQHHEQQVVDLESPDDSNAELSRQVDVNSNLPIICETINDFCARHSREELEHLVRRIGNKLSISDCYYSEVSSTVCMVIEVLDE